MHGFDGDGVTGEIEFFDGGVAGETLSYSQNMRLTQLTLRQRKRLKILIVRKHVSNRMRHLRRLKERVMPQLKLT